MPFTAMLIAKCSMAPTGPLGSKSIDGSKSPHICRSFHIWTRGTGEESFGSLLLPSKLRCLASFDGWRLSKKLTLGVLGPRAGPFEQALRMMFPGPRTYLNVLVTSLPDHRRL